MIIPDDIGEWAIHSAVTEAGRRGLIHLHNAKIREMYRMTRTHPSKQLYWKSASPGFLETQGAKMGNFLVWVQRNPGTVARGTGVVAVAAAGTYVATEVAAPAFGQATASTVRQTSGVYQTKPTWMAPIIWLAELW